MVAPLIFWEGFPPCGLLIKPLVDFYGEDLKVLATRPAVPFENLDGLLGHPIDWLEDANDIWWRREEFADRTLIIHTGWCHPGWLRFDRWSKKRGSKVVVVVDNSWKGTARQYLGALWFRIWLRRHFDAAMVPGKSATRLMQFLGMSREQIFQGCYGAYEGIFRPLTAVAPRKKEFLYVGQLNHRKGVDILLSGFRRYRENGGSWSLRVIGAGPLSEICVGDAVLLEKFAQPNLVSMRMSSAGCVVVPSRVDHWATVVCEAMACGAPVIASRWVGASEDMILNGVNGIILEEMSAKALSECLAAVESWPLSVYEQAQNTSLLISARYRSSNYASSHHALVNFLFKNNHSSHSSQ
jgi:glycosyltransferase involved in cell wall biosynthesis